MTSMKLYRELIASGWLNEVRKIVADLFDGRAVGLRDTTDSKARFITWIAARYYCGLESRESLERALPWLVVQRRLIEMIELSR